MGFTRPFRYTSASFTGGSVHLYREQRLSCCSRLLVLQSCGDPTPQETVSSQPRGATQLPPVSPVRLAAATVGADAPLLAAREALLLEQSKQKHIQTNTSCDLVTFVETGATAAINTNKCNSREECYCRQSHVKAAAAGFKSCCT